MLRPVSDYFADRFYLPQAWGLKELRNENYPFVRD